MARTISEIVAHLKAACTDPAVDTALIQREDVLALCDAVENASSVPKTPCNVDGRSICDTWTPDKRCPECPTFAPLVTAGQGVSEATVAQLKDTLSEQRVHFVKTATMAQTEDAFRARVVKAVREAQVRRELP